MGAGRGNSGHIFGPVCGAACCFVNTAIYIKFQIVKTFRTGFVVEDQRSGDSGLCDTYAGGLAVNDRARFQAVTP